MGCPDRRPGRGATTGTSRRYPDARGNVFTAIELAPLPASGYELKYNRKSVAAPGGCATGTLKPARAPACPISDERALYFGLLGPRAARISYIAAGQHRSVPTGSGGADLIVLSAPGRTKLPGNYMLAAPTPQPAAAQPIRQIICLLRMPDRRTRQGKRDLALLHLLGSAGLRRAGRQPRGLRRRRAPLLHRCLPP